jgi:hypothetical protein
MARRTQPIIQPTEQSAKPLATAEQGNPFYDATPASIDLYATQNAGLLRDLEPSILKGFLARYSLEDLQALPPGIDASMLEAFVTVDLYDRLLQPLLEMPIPEKWKDLKEKIEEARRARASFFSRT